MLGKSCREGQGVSGREEIGMVAKQEEDKKEERPPTQEECNKTEGMAEQESGESIGVEDEKITEKETQESNYKNKFVDRLGSRISF